MTDLQSIDDLIGRSVVSLDSANTLGSLHDLIVDPTSGQLAGFSIEGPHDRRGLLAFTEVHGLGPDALIAEGDNSVVDAEISPLKKLPLAKTHLIGVKVMTEHGQSMGNIANIYLHFGEVPLFIYEVRSSFFDKLLRHALYFPASLAESLSDDRKVLVVTDIPDEIERSLDAVRRKLGGPDDENRLEAPRVPGHVHVTVRSHAE